MTSSSLSSDRNDGVPGLSVWGETSGGKKSTNRPSMVMENSVETKWKEKSLPDFAATWARSDLVAHDKQKRNISNLTRLRRVGAGRHSKHNQHPLLNLDVYCFIPSKNFYDWRSMKEKRRNKSFDSRVPPPLPPNSLQTNLPPITLPNLTAPDSPPNHSFM